jgi:hypothetical protein
MAYKSRNAEVSEEKNPHEKRLQVSPSRLFSNGLRWRENADKHSNAGWAASVSRVGPDETAQSGVSVFPEGQA